jgi:hypothetical protein
VKDFPSRVVCCIPCHNIVDGVETTTFDLVVQCCGEPTGRESFLFTEWTFNKTFHVVSSEAVVQLCFVLESTTLDSDVLIVTEKEKWASMFYEPARLITQYTTMNEETIYNTPYDQSALIFF